MALTKAHNRMIEGAAVNVRDYGAVGDGVTDDTAAIQAAIDSSAKSVHLPSGTYKVTTSLNLKGGLQLWGDGAGTVIEYTGTAYALHNTDKASAAISNVVIEDLIVSTSTGGGIDFEGVYESLIKGNVSIKGHATTPVAGKYGLHTGHSVGATASYWNKINLNKMQGFTHCWYASPNSNSIEFKVQRFKTPITVACVYVAPPNGVNVSSGIDITILDVGNVTAPDTVFFDGRNLRLWMRHEDASSNALHLGVNHRAIDAVIHTMESGVEIALDNIYVDGVIRAGVTGAITQRVYQGYRVDKLAIGSKTVSVEDPCMGSTVNGIWTASGTGSAALTHSTAGSGVLQLSTGGTSGNSETVQFGTAPIRSAARNPARFFGRFRLNSLTQCKFQCGFKRDSDSLPLTTSLSGAWFENDSTTTAVNWFGNQADGSGIDSIDTTVLATAATFNFVVDFAADGTGKFYIDGVLVGDLSAGNDSNSTHRMVPFFYIETKEAVTKTVEIDVFRLDVDVFNYT